MKNVLICFIIGIVVGVICSLVSKFFFEINPIVAAAIAAAIAIIITGSAQVKKWETNHNGNVIAVENRVFSERLFVNGELQDERMGWSVQQRLWGQLDTGEIIKVSIGGAFSVHCRIFVNNKLVLSK